MPTKKHYWVTHTSTLLTSRWTNHIPACGTYVPVPPWFSARVPDIFVAVRVDVHTRQRLRSASFTDLMAPRTIRSTIGEWSFESAAASTWNALPRSVRSSTSVLQFRSRLKTELFARSYQQSCWICLCVTLTQHFCSVILKSLDLRHVNDDSNTN